MFSERKIALKIDAEVLLSNEKLVSSISEIYLMSVFLAFIVYRITIIITGILVLSSLRYNSLSLDVT